MGSSWPQGWKTLDSNEERVTSCTCMAAIVADQRSFGPERGGTQLTGKVLLLTVGVQVGPQDVGLVRAKSKNKTLYWSKEQNATRCWWFLCLRAGWYGKMYCHDKEFYTISINITICLWIRKYHSKQSNWGSLHWSIWTCKLILVVLCHWRVKPHIW